MVFQRASKALAAAVLGSVLSVHAVLAAAPASLAGSWRGAIIGGADRAEVALSVRPNGDQLTVMLTFPSAPTRTIELMPSDTDGILVPRRGGMFRMFGSQDRPDPLRGTPLIWGRVVGESLILYRLEIARDGSYRLEQVVATRTADGVALIVSTRRTGKAPEEITAALRAA